MFRVTNYILNSECGGYGYEITETDENSITISYYEWVDRTKIVKEGLTLHGDDLKAIAEALLMKHAEWEEENAHD